MKKYISKFRTYSLFLFVNGKSNAINFHDLGKLSNCSIFVTNDESLQKALEADARFGTDYFCDGGEEEQIEEKKPEREYDKVYEFVNRTQMAIDILVKDHGQKRSEIKNKADVLQKADELNILFPKLV